jgi:hypothetical protein
MFLMLWSLVAWTFHSIVAWTVSNSAALLGGPGSLAGLHTPDWLASWIPPEFSLALTSLQTALVPAIEAVLNQAPALAGGLSVVTWVVWGIGSALIVILGLVCSALISALRRRAVAHG